MCILMGKSLVVFWNSCLLLQKFWVKNAKNDFGYDCSFYKIEVLVGSNRSTRLEKHKTIEILLWVDVLHIFKNIALFEIVKDF